MQNRQHINMIMSHDMEDDIGKAPQECAPGVTVNGRVTERLVGDAFEGAINGF